MAKLIAFVVATTVCPSAFSSVVGFPTVPAGASINTSLVRNTIDSPTPTSQSGSLNGQVLDDGLGYATALYTGDDGSVTAKIRAGGGGADESVQASVTWFFIVVGLDPTAAPVSVPLYFQGRGLLSIQGLSSYYNHFEYALATATVSSSLPGFNNGPASLSSNGVNNFGLSMGDYALSGQTYSVTLTATAAGGGVNTATIEADLDPLIEVGSDFAAQGYSLVFSPVPAIDGQTPADSVPEPSTNWMMLAGGIGLSIVRVRRRRFEAGPGFV